MGSRKWVLRSLVLTQCCTILGMMAITPGIAGDGDGDGDAVVGRQLAESWCGGCHQIDAHKPGTFPGPNFTDVANLPSTTPLALKVFLRTSHKNMPNILLSDRQVEDLVAYILGLKSK
jgi:mono/diheme cytochrome c family protein